MRKGIKKSIIWEPSKEEFQKIANNSNSLADILRYLGMRAYAGNYKTLNKRILDDQINTSHMSPNINSRRSKTYSTIKKPIEYYLQKGKFVDGKVLKPKLFETNLLKEECSECGLGTIWNGKHISLTIDHINGDNTDNRLENLRILCPNCHSQTSTFSGKHKRHNIINNKSKNSKKCIDCGCNIWKNSTTNRCLTCFNKQQKHPTKIDWPSAEELSKLVWEKPTKQLAKELGVSDSVIGKHIKKLGLTKPPRGYWNKLAAGKI